MRTHDYCIILAGGVGRRLWPASREQRPKQFIDFLGVGRTLLQLTYDRFATFLPPQNIYVSTFADYTSLVQEQLPQLPSEQILSEPVQLSTAPASAWASWHIAQRDPEACLIVTPADQLITSETLFANEVQEAFDYVRQQEHFLALSVRATSPVTTYGYVQKGEALSEHHFTVKTFTEKPPSEFACTFVESGEFLWNTSLFLWHTRTMARELPHLMPALASHDLLAPSIQEEQALLRRCYPAAIHQTIDHLVLSQCKDTLVQECHFGWRDVGTWSSVTQTLSLNVDGNACIGGGNTLFQDTRHTLVHLPKGMGAVVRGLDGYLVALEGNMLVIMPNDDDTRPQRLATEVQVRLGEEFV